MSPGGEYSHDHAELKRPDLWAECRQLWEWPRTEVTEPVWPAFPVQKLPQAYLEFVFEGLLS